MKYIKAFESDNWTPWSAVFEKKFGISTDFIRDILIDVQHEFLDENLYIYIDDAESSFLVEPDNDNIFVIYFDEDKIHKDNLYYLENYMIKEGTIRELKSQIEPYGLEVYGADFGETDSCYEIVICKKGTKVIEKENNRYT